MPLRIATRLLPLALAAAAIQPAAAQDPNLPMPPAFLRAMEPMVPRTEATARVVTTQHRGVFNGTPVAYDAIVTEQPIANAQGVPAAVAVSFGYVARDVPNRARRPVVFVFNGGPGASSSPLHMNAFGPRRIVGEGEAAALADNPYSLLDVADLVFIDPPGTGVSMPVEGADASSLFGVSGDAAAVTTMIRQWLEANGRTQSPVVLVGESYGTARALAVLNAQMEAGQPLPQGVALLSLAIGGSSGPLASELVLFPTLAAVAWYHEAIDRRGRTAQEHFAEALEFARTEYLPALARGVDLPDAERQRVAEGMAALIGIPAEQLAQAGLQLDKQRFMLELLGERGLRTGQLDARVTRAIAESNFHPPFDDPSMTLGTETGRLIARYLEDELGYPLPSEYRSLNLGINFKWDWSGVGGSYQSADFAPFLVRAMAEKPELRVFTGGGIYDITTPPQAGIFALDQAGIPRDRRSTHLYAAGHSVFEDGAGLEALSTDLRRFLRELD
ncbi:S10 family serine carboxypeptidase-like protein [Sphingosinithalassobacter sp. CS137]|uniref:S10 family serine carboxypeptidase-like protein n=1 Tax=Sphingosinithalassobacter sp. CS137 TaxID=2762748 RepID=UPI0021D31493|nr:peptidase S10 [Sphingosinithalassobacter sp. CS137]